MRKILDQTGDLNGQQTHRLLTLYKVPEFVKEASSGEVFAEALPASCYADPVRCQFPTHTKAATILSALFLWDNKDHMTVKEASSIEAELVKRARFFGVYNELVKLKQEYQKRATSDPYKDLPDSDFALILNFTDGTVERHYPMRNPLEIKSAAKHIKDFQDIIPLADRQKIAQKIADKAAVMGVGLGEFEDYIDKQAGYGVCAASDAADLLRSRAAMLRAMKKAPDIRVELEKMAKLCVEHPEQVRSRDSLVKLARIVDDLDRASGLVSEYGTRLDRPEDILFGINIKTAEHLANRHCETITGNIYKIADLRRLDLNDLRDTFGDDFAEAVSAGGLLVSPEKLAEQLSVLPRPDAEILDRMLDQAGVAPMAKKASDTNSIRGDRTFLRTLSNRR